MDQLKNILGTALDMVEEITTKTGETSPKTRPTTATSSASCTGSTPRTGKTQSILISTMPSPSLAASSFAQAEDNFRYRRILGNFQNISDLYNAYLHIRIGFFK